MPLKIPHKISRFIGPAFGLCILITVVIILQRQIKHLTLQGIIDHITAVPTHKILLALLFNLFAYLVLCGYDLLGLRYIHKKIPIHKAAFASILSYIFSNNIGMSIVGASAMRLRFYPLWGLRTASIFRLVIFCSVTMWLGIFTISGLSFIINPIDLPPDIPIPTHLIRPLGFFLLTLVAAYMVLCHNYRYLIKLPGNIIFKLPKLRIALLQPLIGIVDYSLAALVLYTLLPHHTGIHFPIVLTIFLLAQISGMISHVPGGLGVFDAVAFLMLTQYYTSDIALGSIILFRAIYFLLPLLFGAVILLIYELLTFTSSSPPLSPPPAQP
ncbi:Inner membrane protein YbhN [Poriferisphaera corsica]|uniref:Inner membrane protein YbhN n=1 Tax=Poriferisphaera corsica TaxID=2528020 RepID=A0A517YRV8_9BACT|nr:lysylphosphatidylglycerol synthase domain-containing protein [Poriferisphaera corsica]QDU32962.1 Inner membrane protein YbhN [Poriferisphaera corsica]